MEKLTIKAEALCLLVIALTAFVVFSNSLSGEFVYDDQRQVVANPLIQDPKLTTKALTSDVWAFKGDGSVAASNYWRPTFTAWSIINFRLFGLAPFGWHLLNVLLHVGVCLLAFWLLRRLGLPRLAALGIGIVFAVHPVHVESVAWVAGSPDLFFSASLLASLIFADRAFSRERKGPVADLIIATIFYALALGSKEVALLCLPLYWLLWTHRRSSGSLVASGIDPIRELWPFAIAGLSFFFARLAVIGTLSRPAEDAASFGQALMTAPSVAAFYLRQVFFPLTLGTNYPLRPVDQPDVFNFFLPLAVTAAAAAALVLIWRRGPVGRFAAALFVLPLLPAFNITAFIPEQIVHDRYLYLPLLGLLMAIYSAAEFAAGKFAWPLARPFAVACCLASVPLTVVTAGYNAVWKTDLRLWQQAVTVDPGSAFNWNQLGAELTEQKRYSDAIEAYDRSLSVKRTPLAVMGRSRNLMSLQRYPEAISELQAAAKTPGDKINLFTLYQIYETLAIAQQAAGDGAGAEATLRDGRAKMPIYSAALTEKLGVILYMQGRKRDALNELESVRAQAEKEMLIDAKVVYLRLGMLYAEAGRPQEARRDLQRFLDATVNSTVPEIVNDRAQAAAAIQRLR